MSNKKTHAEFIEEMSSIQPNIKVLGIYRGAKEYVSVQCANCGYVWDSMPTNLLKGRHCPICSNKNKADKRRRSQQEFEDILSKISNNVLVLGEYKNDKTYIDIMCKNCNTKWRALPNALLRGSNCPRCSRTGTSWAEQIIYLSLKRKIECEVISRDRTIIGQELDIVIPSKKIAIEYGAWNWHEGKILRDQAKHNLCKEKGIRLITIFDAFPNKCADTDDTWYYRENIGKKENVKVIQDILDRIFHELKIEETISADEFEEIQHLARMNSRKLTRECLNKKLSEQGIPIIVLSEYQDALSKVEARCVKCGHEWEVIPASLLRGLGCPKCGIQRRADKARKSNSDFITDLKRVNPNVELISEYVSRHTKVKAKCLIHNYQWEITPDSLLRGSGCPKCKREKIIAKNMKDEGKFLNEMEQLHPEIEVKGHYNGGGTKIECRCKYCGNEWKVTPGSLLAGHGCPKCGAMKSIKGRTKTHKQYVEELYAINPTIEVLGQYETGSSYIQIRCGKCNNIWSAKASSLLQGFGCSKCAGNKKKTHEEFIEQLLEVNGDVVVLGRYEQANKPLLVKCKKCEVEWFASPSNLLHGRGCPRCARKNKKKDS